MRTVAAAIRARLKVSMLGDDRDFISLFFFADRRSGIACARDGAQQRLQRSEHGTDWFKTSDLSLERMNECCCRYCCQRSRKKKSGRGGRGS